MKLVLAVFLKIVLVYCLNSINAISETNISTSPSISETNISTTPVNIVTNNTFARVSSTTSKEQSSFVTETTTINNLDNTEKVHQFSYPDNNCPELTPAIGYLNQDQLTNILTNECRYDKLVKPPTDGPLPIYVQIDLTHIESADQLQFRTQMLIQYVYRDKRLKYDHVFPERGNLLGEELLRNKIWVPHILIRNEKDTRIMGLDGKDVFISISPKGDVIYSYRMTATFYCWMNLKKFPFDTQHCFLRWNSWTYNSTNLVLHWDQDDPVKIARNLHLTEFILSGNKTEERIIPASFSKGSHVGNFSELIFHFELSREVGYYVMDYFLPSILLVCTSWVSFWLQADASAPRVTLGTSTMLTFITLNGGINKNLPKVSYIKANEIWFLACACFIFSSMAEFAFVNVIWRRKKKVELKKHNSKHILKGALTPSLARKQLRKAESINSLHKSNSCTSLDSKSDCGSIKEKHNNYLTVHSFPTLRVPGITTQSADEFTDNDDYVTSIPISNSNNQNNQHWHTMSPHEVANWIDKKSRLVFPISFIIFNIFYWTFVYVL